MNALDVQSLYGILPPELRRQLALVTRTCHLPRGERVFAEGEPGDEVFVLRRGRLLVERATCGGGTRGLCVIVPGQIFCCLSFLDGGPYPGTAVAAVDSVVERTPRLIFRELLERHPAFGRGALARFGMQMREAGCGDAPLGDTGARLASRLLELASRFGGDIPLLRREIGSLAGTTTETTIRQLRAFQRAGWVRLGRGRVRVLDRRALGVRAGRESTHQGCAPAGPPIPPRAATRPASRSPARSPCCREAPGRRGS